MKLSIVIATYNRGERLMRTLRSLAAQSLPTDRWEAIVVNNNSTDGTPERFAWFAAGHPGLNLRMVDEPRQGLSHARNRGIAESQGEIIVMIDDDEEVNSGFMSAYESFFTAHPEACAGGGKMVACYEESRPRWMSHYTEILAASTIDMGDRVGRFPKGRYPIGGNMAFRREVFSRLGVFRTDLGRTGDSLIGGEEKDMFGRIAREGGEIWWVPGAVADHIIPASRLTRDHFTKLGTMVGASGRIIALSSGRGGMVRALVAEVVKWVATLLIALWFAATLRPSKAHYLIMMRGNISTGLLRRRQMFKTPS